MGADKCGDEGRSCSSVLAPPLACADRSNTVYQLTKNVDDNLCGYHVEILLLLDARRRVREFWMNIANSGQSCQQQKGRPSCCSSLKAYIVVA